MSRPTAIGPFAASLNEIPKAFFTQKGFKGIDPVPATTAEQSPTVASWVAALPEAGRCKGFPGRSHSTHLQHIRLIFR